MPPAAIGVDLIAVAEVRGALRAHGDRYLQQVFTAQEVDACRGPWGPDPRRLAERFAVKEAALKSLRPQDGSLPWTDVDVVGGPPYPVQLRLTGSVARLARDRRLHTFDVTMSTASGMAAAIVIANTVSP